VRGFFAGVLLPTGRLHDAGDGDAAPPAQQRQHPRLLRVQSVRKKLGLNLESEKTDGDRIYRITGRASSRSEARSGS